MIRLLWLLTGLVNLGRLFVAMRLPLTGDEAYYWEWSQRLAFGYVDHPPAVAWMIAAFAWMGHRAASLRFGFWLCGMVTTLAAADAARRLAQREALAGTELDPCFAAALAGSLLSLAPLVSLAFTTVSPDGPYLAAWACVIDLVFICEALPWRRSLPLALGISLGVALMTRAFAMVLVPTVGFALAQKRKALGLIFVMATLVCIPFLVWNAQHHWVNLYFTLSGRHVYEGLSLLRPLMSLLIVLLALGVGPGIFAFGLARKISSRVLLMSAYGLVAVVVLVGFFERVEIYWFLGPYLSASIAAAVVLARTHRRPNQWLQQPSFLVPFGGAALLTLIVFIVALAPFQVLGMLEIQMNQRPTNSSIFEIFTYQRLAHDLRDLSQAHHAIIMTDGYGFSSLLDFEAGIIPLVIGYDWQGREAHSWVSSDRSFPLALFVDKEPLSKRQDFAQRLAQACHVVRSGPQLQYPLPGLPARRYSTTWCKGMQPHGIAVLRWERDS